MLTLAIDTAANFCSACLWDETDDRVLAAEERDIGRGHAEELLRVVDEVVRRAGAGYGDLGRIAVAIGPGSFTGIRVGVAAARGFGLALDLPVVGVTTLEALAADAMKSAAGPVTVAVNGGRGECFMQAFDAAGQQTGEAFAVGEAAAAAQVPADAAVLAGNAAAALAATLAAEGRVLRTVHDRATGAIETVARLSAISAHKPVPLYLRGADAKPQQGFTLARAQSAGGPGQ